MRRTLGATAIFLGWLCLPLSAIAGFAAANLMNVDNRHSGLPPVTVFGFSSDLFMWLVVLAAVLATAPAFVAIFAVDPSRELYVTGAGIAIVAVLLLFDDLGRAYSVVLLPAAACFAAAGWLMAGARNEPPAWASSELLAHLRKPPVPPGPQIGFESFAEMGLADQGDLAPVGPEPGSPAAPAEAAVAEVAEGQGPTAAVSDLAESTDPQRGLVAAAEPAIPAPAVSPESGAEIVCPWCSARIAAAPTCPECGAILDTESGADGVVGVTEVSPELLEYLARTKRKPKRRSVLLQALGVEALRKEANTDVPVSALESALRPPTAEVRAEMARIDAEIARQAAWSESQTPAEPAAAEPAAAGPAAAAEAAAPEPVASPEPVAAPELTTGPAAPEPTAAPQPGAEPAPQPAARARRRRSKA